MDGFLNFWVENNALIIDITFIIAIPLGIYVLYRSLKDGQKKTGVTAQVASRKNKFIEEPTEKLEEFNVTQEPEVEKVEIARTTGLSVEAEQPVVQNNPEKQALVNDLKSKISDLEGQLANQPDPSLDNQELLTKVQELEDKLGEYEIIEDDIANLSFYKNENQKLLAKLKQAGIEFESEIPQSETEAEVADSIESSTKEKRPQGGDHMKQFEQVVGVVTGDGAERKAAEEPSQEVAEPEDEPEEVDLSEEMIMAAVGEESSEDMAAPAEESSKDMAAAAEESSEDTAAAGEESSKDTADEPPEGPKDLIAEFENFVKNS